MERKFLGIEIKPKYTPATAGDIYSIKSLLRAWHDYIFKIGIYKKNKYE